MGAQHQRQSISLASCRHHGMLNTLLQKVTATLLAVSSKTHFFWLTEEVTQNPPKFESGVHF